MKARPAGRLVLALMLACPSGVGLAAAETQLRLKLADFDPVSGPPSLAAHLVLADEPEAGIFVVQFDREIDPALLQSVRETGAETLGYLPERAYLLRLPAGGPAAVRGLPGVRWVGAVQPGWKLSPVLGRRSFEDPTHRGDGKLYATADLYAGTDADAAAAQVAALGVELIQIQRFGGTVRLKLRGTLAQLEQAARVPEISWIEELAEITPRNNQTRWVIQTDVPASTTVWDRGLHGEGQIIGHIDGRLDINSCWFRDEVDNTPGPGHRKVLAYRSSSGIGASSHGTHTAGTAGGDQFPVSGIVDHNGQAYAAKITHGNSGDVSGFNSSPSNFYSFLVDAHNDGARVHTNSWGDDGLVSYTTWCVDIDRFSYDFEDSLVLFAATNTSTLRTPENAKNVLAVGGTNAGSGADNHCTGGVGPTSDGRRKPEIYAPGCGIVSARNNTDCSTGTQSGTSMACPAVTGAGALVRQYLEQGYYPSGAPRPQDAMLPSGALTKAILLNSTVDMTGIAGYPSNLEGWGRLLLENALFFDGDTRKLSVLADVRNADGLTDDATHEHTLAVEGGSEQLKITLVFTDPPAALMAALAPVNNIDLEVRSPSGTLYYGNDINTSTGQSNADGGPDPLNNVEMVILDNPEVGDWTITVRGTGVNQDTQGYALVASGEIHPFSPGALRFAGLTIQDAPPLGNDDGIADPGETFTLPVTLNNNGAATVSGIQAGLTSNLGALVKITDDLADYPDIDSAGSGTSLTPHYRMTVSPAASCGTTVNFSLDTLSNEGEGAAGFAFDIGRVGVSEPAAGLPLPIPKKNSTGLITTVAVSDAFLIADVQLRVSLAHDDIGELEIELTSPQGSVVTLHDHSGAGVSGLSTTYDGETLPDGPGTMNDFDGEQAQGTWTLRIADTVGGPVKPGELLEWRLDIVATSPIDCSPLACGEPTPAEVVELTLNSENGNDLRLDWTTEPGATGYRVWSSLDPDFVGETLAGTATVNTHLEPGGLAGDDLVFYQVRAVNACEWEGP